MYKNLIELQEIVDWGWLEVYYEVYLYQVVLAFQVMCLILVECLPNS